MRVLIVDDSGTARKILKSVLPAPLRSNLVEAGGGRQAVEICRAEKIDLMFLDLTMPELDGYGVLAELGELCHRIPIVVVSADVQPGAQERVKALGARAFVKKTPSGPALVQALAAAGVTIDAA
jgi:CheY-like chemotaxis protein